MVSVALLSPTAWHDRPVPVHPPPRGQRPDRAALRDRVLAQGVLSAVLPGDGGARPALRLPAFPPGGITSLCVRRRADRHQLLPAEQRVRLHRQPAELVALAHRGGARPDLLGDVAGAFGWLVLRTDDGSDRPSSSSRTARATRWARAGGGRRAARRGTRPAAPVRCAYLELVAPDLRDRGGGVGRGGRDARRVVPLFLGTGRHVREDLPPLCDAAARRPSGASTSRCSRRSAKTPE